MLGSRAGLLSTTLSPVAREVPVFLLDHVIYKISRFPDLRRTEAERSERGSTVQIQ